MILIGLGANLPSVSHGAPRQTLEAALIALEGHQIKVSNRSRWYTTAPVPVSDQPHFVNIVVSVTTNLAAGAMLQALHHVEDTFGRVREARNAARVLDIDLLDYNGLISLEWPVLPHPHMDQRAFVLVPLRDIVPDWVHPATGRGIDALLAEASDLSGVELLDDEITTR